jgi:2-polyprenyl-3-methyl-5-hydroxy-6-metoxy-1,4-benzoquinol methylase
METMHSSWEQQAAAGQRFRFGDNWQRFLSQISDNTIEQAQASLSTRLGKESLAGSSFLDAGCGSGLFSLAARRLGAQVHSFDYDPHSVACTQQLKARHAENDTQWTIERGSLLDTTYLNSIRGGAGFDCVYSWGVLHHTGAMWQALSNLLPLVKPEGLLYIALYNDQGAVSRGWTLIKKIYCRLPVALQPLLSLPIFLALWSTRLLVDGLQGHPLRRILNYSDHKRGMRIWRDHIDWIGGYPFEVARVDQVFNFLRERGFSLQRLHCVGVGMGCNEFVFRRAPSAILCS